MSFTEVVFRITLSFFVFFILTKIMGRKEISQMTFTNFVSAIAIGSIAANLAFNSHLRIIHGVAALVGWSFYTVLLDYLTLNFKRIRKIIADEPLIVIKNGKIMERTLRKSRLTIDNLQSLLRQKDIFSLKDVEYAIFETDGKLSVMKKEDKIPVTKKDLNIPLSNQSMYPIAMAVISDGVINQEILSKIKLKRDWLEHQLQEAGVQDLSHVFYAEIQPDGSLYVDQRTDNLN